MRSHASTSPCTGWSCPSCPIRGGTSESCRSYPSSTTGSAPLVCALRSAHSSSKACSKLLRCSRIGGLLYIASDAEEAASSFLVAFFSRFLSSLINCVKMRAVTNFVKQRSSMMNGNIITLIVVCELERSTTFLILPIHHYILFLQNHHANHMEFKSKHLMQPRRKTREMHRNLLIRLFKDLLYIINSRFTT